jgi:hypothetical protein
MLTDYFVHCPNEECNWRGTLFPKSNRERSPVAVGMMNVIHFQCPHCQREWRARIVGEDAIPLPELAAPAV